MKTKKTKIIDESPEEEVPKKTGKVKDNYYVDPKLFRKQLEEYYSDDNMTNELAINITKIAEGLGYNWRFLKYSKSWKDEMIGDAVLKMYMALESKKFNLKSSFSPFAYFNKIAWNAFSNRIKREKRLSEGLENYKQMVYEEEMNDPNSMGYVYVKPCSSDCEDESDYD